jgi:hypothetical protein
MRWFLLSDSPRDDAARRWFHSTSHWYEPTGGAWPSPTALPCVAMTSPRAVFQESLAGSQLAVLVHR